VKRSLTALFAVVLALSASVAWAQPAQSDEERKQAARELANKAYEHYEAGEYGRAILYFRDAEAKFHAPTLLLVQAHAHVKLGQLVEARALYQRIVDEKLAEDAPKEFVDAQAAARKQADLMTARIATLKIVFKGMTADKVTVTIDDVEIPTAQILEPIPQNPGNHKIVATLGGEEGGRQVYQAVTLKEGTTKTVQLVFRKGGPVETPPAAGGCASCEIGARREGGGELYAASSTVAVAFLAALRRRRRRPRS
jgi:tetratricopeptide (TPR) repeat protein